MIDITTLPSKFKLFKAPEGKNTTDCVYYEFRGKTKTNAYGMVFYDHVFPWSNSILGAYVTGNSNIKKVLEFGELKQYGRLGKHVEAIVIFYPEDLPKVGEILSLRSKRILSPEQKERLDKQLKRWRKRNA